MLSRKEQRIAELREAGFDPWFVEKRRGALRMRVLEAQVD